MRVRGTSVLPARTETGWAATTIQPAPPPITSPHACMRAGAGRVTHSFTHSPMFGVTKAEAAAQNRARKAKSLAEAIMVERCCSCSCSCSCGVDAVEGVGGMCQLLALYFVIV